MSDGYRYFAIIDEPRRVPRIFGVYLNRDAFERELIHGLRIHCPETRFHIITETDTGARWVRSVAEFLDPGPADPLRHLRAGKAPRCGRPMDEFDTMTRKPERVTCRACLRGGTEIG